MAYNGASYGNLKGKVAGKRIPSLRGRRRKLRPFGSRRQLSKEQLEDGLARIAPRLWEPYAMPAGESDTESPTTST